MTPYERISEKLKEAALAMTSASSAVLAVFQERNEARAHRDRLAVENARLRAALWEMLSHYAPDPDDDTEAAVSAYAVLGEQAGSEEAF